MGVELRSVQRKFHYFMDEVHPDIRPQFFVWLDERLAEYKIKGDVDLSESLEDPHWINAYYISKHGSRASAVMESVPTCARSPADYSVQLKSEVSPAPVLLTKLECIEDQSLHQEDNVELPGQHSDVMNRVTETDSDLVHVSNVNNIEVKQELLEEETDDEVILGETFCGPDQCITPCEETSTHRLSDNHYIHKHDTHERVQPSTMGFDLQSSETVVLPSTLLPQSERSFTEKCHSECNTEPPMFSENAMPDSDYLPPSCNESTLFSDNELLRIPSQDKSYQLHLPSADNLTIRQKEENGGYVIYVNNTYNSSDTSNPPDMALRVRDSKLTIDGERGVDPSSVEQFPGISPVTYTEDANLTGWRRRKYTQLNRVALYGTVCPVCKKTFKSPRPLREHYRFSHLKERWYVCEFCDKSFSRTNNLIAHRNSVHLGIRPFSCHCKATFTSKGGLQSHTKRCKKCPK